ncbi:MAG: amidoligase family protein [Woeseia sp.]
MDENKRQQFSEDWRPPLPAVTDTDEGKPRRVGVELEIIGLDVDTVSEIVTRHFNGKREIKTRYEHRVHGDKAGDWGIELDFEYLKQKGRENASDDEQQELIDEAAENLLRAGAETVVPVEVVGPPLPMARLGEVQSLIARLREAGAKGSGANISYAFGMQFNPELPSLDARMITSYLKAFLCLYDWLVVRSAPDFTRRLTGFSAPFPGKYVRKVINPDYWPDQDALIDDYLTDNPTRNRALDMLPLFLHLDKKRVRETVDDPRVKARPTLHYRLPNCEIDRTDWGIHLAWNDWLEVEALALDESRLNEVCKAYAGWLDDLFGRLFDNWAEEVESWLADSKGL